MMNLNILKGSERKEIARELEGKYGISTLPSLLVESGNYKVRMFTGSMLADEIMNLAKVAHIEVVGLYALKREKHGLRLSLDACHQLADQINKGIVDLTAAEAAQWMKGDDVEKETTPGPVVLRLGTDFLGSGFSSGSKIPNQVPKERRVK